jgi:DNA-binding transcriptional MerR regulator
MRSDGLLTVVEVTRRTGLSRKALRVYEEAGIVVPAGRTAAGYRLYGAEALRRLELLRRAKALGLHLREDRVLGGRRGLLRQEPPGTGDARAGEVG